METKIIITCFEPFGGADFNASAAVTAEIPEILAGIPTEKMTLPVEFGRAADIAVKKARGECASLLVCFGEAGGRKNVTPELMAINLQYASIPDNAGNSPCDEAIVPGGAAAYFTSFPARRLALSIKEAGVPCMLSYSAGAYVCNDLYYRLLREFEGSDTRVIFIHVPRAEDDKNYKNMASAISAALSEIISE